jgi:hypothetical protein
VEVGQIVRRVILVDDHVAGQRGPPADALEQVVADQRVLRDPAVEAGPETVDVVDALADVDAFAEEIR